jgi:hypothetical protein
MLHGIDSEIHKNIFDELNKYMSTNTIYVFITLLKFILVDNEMYINALNIKLKKPKIILQRLCKNIHINPFGIHVGKFWQANTDTQFILNLYNVVNYGKSYLTKIDKMVVKKLKPIITNCNEIKTQTRIHIQKMGIFFNAQQMSPQLITYIIMSIQLCHAYKTFKVINTSPIIRLCICIEKCT